MPGQGATPDAATPPVRATPADAATPLAAPTLGAPAFGGGPVPSAPGRGRYVFDGAFIGPMLPPEPPAAPLWIPGVMVPPPPSAAVLALPLRIRSLVREALDMLTRPDNGLRGASFYIGFMMLLTVAPLIALLALIFLATGDFTTNVTAGDGFGGGGAGWVGWLLLAGIPATLGYVAATVEARALATAVIGARLEGRPLHLRESIALARQRFWTMLGAQLITGFIGGGIGVVASLVVMLILGPVGAINDGVSLLVGLLVGAPVVYVPAAIILGGTGIVDSFRRSFRLVAARKRLAVVVTLFGLISQFIVLFGLSSGLDAVARLVGGAGLAESFPAALVIPITAALVFALGTLVFLVEAIAAAPPVFAFTALTHYTWGLEAGRRAPIVARHAWDPWGTPGLAIAALIGLLALLGGVGSLPG